MHFSLFNQHFHHSPHKVIFCMSQFDREAQKWWELRAWMIGTDNQGGNNYTPCMPTSRQKSGHDSGRTPTRRSNMHSGEKLRQTTLPRRWPVLPEIWRIGIQHWGMQQWASHACADQKGHPWDQQKHRYMQLTVRWQTPMMGGRLACSVWTITTVLKRQKELQLDKSIPDHRHWRWPHPRRVVKHQHTCQRRKWQQEQHMEDAVLQWILMQHTWQQSASDVASSATSSTTAPMCPRAGKKPCGASNYYWDTHPTVDAPMLATIKEGKRQCQEVNDSTYLAMDLSFIWYAYCTH